MATEAKTVDSSLWWDPFDSLLTDLEHASHSSDLPEPLVGTFVLSMLMCMSKRRYHLFLLCLCLCLYVTEFAGEEAGGESFLVRGHCVAV